ncbi:hypothetical protein FQN49_002152 [Arthroderma sp. PD_2]|nr:hypothetical protein FQN49_002152 [Arthroderma sp. PD_2]
MALGVPIYQLGIPDLRQIYTLGWMAVIRTLGYYTVYPIVFFSTIFFSTLGFFAAPIIELSSHLLYFCLLPWHMSTKLEPLYKFFGVAAVIGIATGWVLHLTSTYISHLLNLRPRSRAVSNQWCMRKRKSSWEGRSSVKPDWATQFVNSNKGKADSLWKPKRGSVIGDQPGPSGLRVRQLRSTKMAL